MIRISGTPKFVFPFVTVQIIYAIRSGIFRSIAIHLIIAGSSPQCIFVAAAAKHDVVTIAAVHIICSFLPGRAKIPITNHDVIASITIEEIRTGTAPYPVIMRATMYGICAVTAMKRIFAFVSPNLIITKSTFRSFVIAIIAPNLVISQAAV